MVMELKLNLNDGWLELKIELIDSLELDFGVDYAL